MNPETQRALSALFPAGSGTHPPFVADALEPGETVAWSGGPQRWGLFRITPFLIAIAGFLVVLTATGLQAGYAGPIDFLQGFLLAQQGSDALIVPMLGVLLAALMIWWMRDPRGKWHYVVTDQRLLVFYRGKKLREAGPDNLDKLRVIEGVERRLRNLGNIVWRVHIRTDGGTGGGGPDAGQHGFRGMRDPQQWRERLLKWRDVLSNASRSSSSAFVDGAADDGAHHDVAAGRRRLDNRRFGFTIDVPTGWTGKVGTAQVAPVRILGINTPFTKSSIENTEPVDRAGGDWDCLRLRGAAGVVFALDVRPGQATHDFATFTRPLQSDVHATDETVTAGSLKGWSVDYPLNQGKEYVSYTLLQGDDYHVVINARIARGDVDVQREAVLAIRDSIATRD